MIVGNESDIKMLKGWSYKVSLKKILVLGEE